MPTTDTPAYKRILDFDPDSREAVESPKPDEAIIKFQSGPTKKAEAKEQEKMRRDAMAEQNAIAAEENPDNPKWRSQRNADPDGLTGLERRFCDAYLYYFDGEKAYLAAGGREKNYMSAAGKMLGREAVKNFIRRRIEMRETATNKFGFDPHDSVYRLQMISRANLGPFINADTGAVDMNTPQAQANIDLLKEVIYEETPSGVRKWKITLIDPLQAAKAILSSVGAFSQPERDREREQKEMDKVEGFKLYDLKNPKGNQDAPNTPKKRGRPPKK